MEPEQNQGRYADINTGELVDFIAVPRRQGAVGGGWLKTMQNALQRIVRDNLTDGDRTVFLELLSRTDWNNLVVINVTELALEIGKSRPFVSAALGRLVDHGYLIRGPRAGRSASYRLSPDVGWKGNDSGYVSLQRKVRERGMKVVEGGADEAPGQTSIDLQGDA